MKFLKDITDEYDLYWFIISESINAFELLYDEQGDDELTNMIFSPDADSTKYGDLAVNLIYAKLTKILTSQLDRKGLQNLVLYYDEKINNTSKKFIFKRYTTYSMLRYIYSKLNTNDETTTIESLNIIPIGILCNIVKGSHPFNHLEESSLENIWAYNGSNIIGVMKNWREYQNRCRSDANLLTVYSSIALFEYHWSNVKDSLKYSNPIKKMERTSHELSDRLQHLSGYLASKISTSLARKLTIEELLKDKKELINILVEEDFNYCVAKNYPAYRETSLEAFKQSERSKTGKFNLSRTAQGRKIKINLEQITSVAQLMIDKK